MDRCRLFFFLLNWFGWQFSILRQIFGIYVLWFFSLQDHKFIVYFDTCSYTPCCPRTLIKTYIPYQITSTSAARSPDLPQVSRRTREIVIQEANVLLCEVKVIFTTTTLASWRVNHGMPSWDKSVPVLTVNTTVMTLLHLMLMLMSTESNIYIFWDQCTVSSLM